MKILNIKIDYKKVTIFYIYKNIDIILKFNYTVYIHYNRHH